MKTNRKRLFSLLLTLALLLSLAAPAFTLPAAADEQEDNDLLSTASSIEGSSFNGHTKTIQGDTTQGSAEALKIEQTGTSANAWPKLIIYVGETISADMTVFSMDIKHGANIVPYYIAFFDKSGTQLSTPSSGEKGVRLRKTSSTEWQNYQWRIADLGLTSEELPQIYRIDISINNTKTSNVGQCLYMDNMQFTAGGEDLLDSSMISPTSMTNISYLMQKAETNGSTQALRVRAETASPSESPKLNLKLAETLTNNAEGLSFDLKFDGSHKWFRIKLKDSSGAELGKYETTPSAEGWINRKVSWDQLGITADEISKIAQVDLDFWFPSSTTQGATVYVDNLKFESSNANALSTEEFLVEKKKLLRNLTAEQAEDEYEF